MNEKGRKMNTEKGEIEVRFNKKSENVMIKTEGRQTCVQSKASSNICK